MHFIYLFKDIYFKLSFTINISGYFMLILFTYNLFIREADLNHFSRRMHLLDHTTKP